MLRWRLLGHVHYHWFLFCALNAAQQRDWNQIALQPSGTARNVVLPMHLITLRFINQSIRNWFSVVFVPSYWNVWVYQGLRCLLEICLNRHKILRILCQWSEKCVQHNLEDTKPKWWSNLNVAGDLQCEQTKIVFKKVYPCTHTHKVETFSKYAVHKKVWRDRNIVRGIIFRGWAAADDVGKPSSRLLLDLVTRWSWNWGCRYFLSFVQCQRVFCFRFRSLLPLGKFWYWHIYADRRRILGRS